MIKFFKFLEQAIIYYDTKTGILFLSTKHLNECILKFCKSSKWKSATIFCQIDLVFFCLSPTEDILYASFWLWRNPLGQILVILSSGNNDVRPFLGVLKKSKWQNSQVFCSSGLKNQIECFDCLMFMFPAYASTPHWKATKP
jgi:hypothetical protein